MVEHGRGQSRIYFFSFLQSFKDAVSGRAASSESWSLGFSVSRPTILFRRWDAPKEMGGARPDASGWANLHYLEIL